MLTHSSNKYFATPTTTYPTKGEIKKLMFPRKNECRLVWCGSWISFVDECDLENYNYIHKHETVCMFQAWYNQTVVWMLFKSITLSWKRNAWNSNNSWTKSMGMKVFRSQLYMHLPSWLMKTVLIGSLSWTIWFPP